MPKKPKTVREPVQVYLGRDDRDLLERVASAAGISRAEALRRGLKHLATDILAAEDPAHAFLARVADAPWPPGTPDDLAARHDEHLASALRRGATRRRR